MTVGIPTIERFRMYVSPPINFEENKMMFSKRPGSYKFSHLTDIELVKQESARTDLTPLEETLLWRLETSRHEVAAIQSETGDDPIL